MSEIIETAVTWDHDTGDVFVDTRRKSVATRLRKLGFAVTYEKNSGYYQLRAQDAELGISFFRRKAKLTRPRKLPKRVHEPVFDP